MPQVSWIATVLEQTLIASTSQSIMGARPPYAMGPLQGVVHVGAMVISC